MGDGNLVLFVWERVSDLISIYDGKIETEKVVIRNNIKKRLYIETRSRETYNPYLGPHGPWSRWRRYPTVHRRR